MTGNGLIERWLDSGDGHPDHEAVGRAAAVAAQRRDAVLVKYPILKPAPLPPFVVRRLLTVREVVF